MEHTLEGISFKANNIHMKSELNAAEQANRLAVEEGIPFREAYRRIAGLLDEIDS
jgi:argininosuccinate lyase